MTSRVGLWMLLAPLLVNALTGPWLVASGENGDERIVGVLLTSFSLLASLVAWRERSAPARLTWGALWTVPGAFGGTAAVMVVGGAGGLGGYYAASALVAAVGLTLWRATDA